VLRPKMPMLRWPCFSCVATAFGTRWPPKPMAWPFRVVFRFSIWSVYIPRAYGHDRALVLLLPGLLCCALVVLLPLAVAQGSLLAAGLGGASSPELPKLPRSAWFVPCVLFVLSAAAQIGLLHPRWCLQSALIAPVLDPLARAPPRAIGPDLAPRLIGQPSNALGSR